VQISQWRELTGWQARLNLVGDEVHVDEVHVKAFRHLRKVQLEFLKREGLLLAVSLCDHLLVFDNLVEASGFSVGHFQLAGLSFLHFFLRVG
jgi:hypothetical protein